MMRIESLKIENLRIIQSMEFKPTPGVNFIQGDNGAGKTTILEAMHLLGKGQSFRHVEAGPLIRQGCPSALVVGTVRDHLEQRFNLGIERKKDGFRARKNGAEIEKRSELLRALPLQILLPSSHAIVEREPELRRRYIDQALFHVEHGYHRLLLDYGRALKHRNAALRVQQREVARSFNSRLASCGEEITARRRGLVESLEQEVNRVLGELGASLEVKMRYLRGWGEGDLGGFLEANEERDLERGYTTRGPHRGELKITVNDRPVDRFLSRGEQKLVIYAMAFSLIERIKEVTGESPVLLIDDLQAEFDRSRIDGIINYLGSSGVQVFVTMVGVMPQWEGRFRMFHVEQGVLLQS